MSKEKPPHRALVLQGGGAIGAYEAGVFKVLYFWIKKDIRNKNENIFDVVAGTSIGAINGAILVSYVQEKGTWEGAPERLSKFWEYISSTPDLSNWWPFWFNWPYPWSENSWMKVWDERHTINPSAATGEAARRFYSTKEYILSGAPKVFSKEKIVYDNKFFNDFPSIPNNTWFRYDNRPLKESIKQYAKFPIATSFDKKQPRLIIITVDVEEAEIVAFDSYVKKDGHRNSEYGYDEKKKEYIQKMEYDDGLMAEHIIASASVPVHYDYAFVPIKYDYTKSEEEKETKLKEDLQQDNLKSHRRFWDGGILSNTPLRELIQVHQDYWKEVEDAENVPDLEVYVIDVWPWMEKGKYPISSDYDSVINRKNELTYQDKTPYDEKVANIVSDYYDLANVLLDLARKKGATNTDLNEILTRQTKSAHRTGEKRRYHDLLDKRFDITKLIRIERSGDTDDISNKWCDFSSDTISKLFKQGMDDALQSLAKYAKEHNKKNIQVAYDQLNTFINEINSQKSGQDSYNHYLIEAAKKAMLQLPDL